MKRHLWLAMVTYLAYCPDQELWKAIDYLKEQVQVLKEQQEKEKRILLPHRSHRVQSTPLINAHAERSVRSVKEECLDLLLLSSEEQLRYVLSEYLQYYHHERIHQGLNRIIEPQHAGNQGEITCIEHLGGLLKSYHRKAA